MFFILISSPSTLVSLIPKKPASETEIEPIRLFSTFIILNPADVRFPSISPSVILISPFCTNTASLHFIFIPSKVSPVASSIYKPNFSVSISTSLILTSDFSLMYIPYSWLLIFNFFNILFLPSLILIPFNPSIYVSQHCIGSTPSLLMHIFSLFIIPLKTFSFPLSIISIHSLRLISVFCIESSALSFIFISFPSTTQSSI